MDIYIILYLDQNRYSYIELGIYEDILCMYLYTIEICIIIEICKNICFKNTYHILNTYLYTCAYVYVYINIYWTQDDLLQSWIRPNLRLISTSSWQPYKVFMRRPFSEKAWMEMAPLSTLQNVQNKLPHASQNEGCHILSKKISTKKNSNKKIHSFA